MVTYFRDDTRKPEKKSEKDKILPASLKTVDTFVTIVTTSSSVKLFMYLELDW